MNSNAAWVSLRLENLGVRVASHLTVRDNPDEILEGLRACNADLVIVTGGLGPTSDDVTRECLARHCGTDLEFDDSVFAGLEKLYRERGLHLREAHKHQCRFPIGSERLPNPVGTALGFVLKNYFVLPGPPRELEGMWREEVEPRLKKILPQKNSHRWIRWTCLGLPESEVAELVEPVIAETGLEVGYRAAVPYVKVKVYCDPVEDRQVLSAIESALGDAVVAHDFTDLAEELLAVWPLPTLRVVDYVTDGMMAHRLFGAQRELRSRGEKFPHLSVQSEQAQSSEWAGEGIELRRHGEELVLTMKAGGVVVNERMSLPYKLSLSAERGRKTSAEWAIWFCVRKFRARP